MNTLVSFVVVLGILIFVHELGHFLFAKLFKVRVLKFSLGFGPKLFGRTIGETEYVISAFPLGGYVKMFGENPDEQEEAAGEKAVSFAHKAVWQRFLIVFAGPLFNLLFSVLLFFLIFSFVGLPDSRDTTRVGQVNLNSPAAAADIQVDDIILSINGQPTLQWMDVLNMVKDSKGQELSLQVLRADKELQLGVTPSVDMVKNIFGEEVEERYMIGIVKAEELFYTPTGLIGAFAAACSQTWMYISLTVMGFVKLAQQVIPVKELGGPILIAQIAGKQMQAGWINLAYFMGLLSVNLGILNLLPIPVLDGGHLVFLGVEAVRRKPMTEKIQIVAQQVGMAFLGTLMIFVFYNDIARIFGW
ncbi:MAG: RIP metalloprotease RseP [Proteobacteria bacterium]|nr:RIP metalloprotease RseP [Pseudomonadota bacterium]MBU1419401.1 RIP metalloprotease RseP [Pseudomonadota bacterium]MBU1454241.1 RIP metalloprotease RseP [Pseudomonadota bacterium]